MPSLNSIPQDILVNESKWTSPSWLSWFNQIYRLLRGAPFISQGIVAPTSTPEKVGDMYVDTVAGKVYVATDTTNSAGWKILN